MPVCDSLAHSLFMTATQTPQRPTPATNGRLLILNIGRLGDTILRNSILDSAFRTFATVDYVCGRHNAALLLSDTRLSEVIVFSNSFAGWTSMLKSGAGPRYDALIDLKNHASSISLIFARLFRSRVKTGCNRDHFKPFDRDARTVLAPNLHMLETMRRIGRLAGLAEGDYKANIVLPLEAIVWFRHNYAFCDQPFIFLNVSATDSDRVWPVESWARYVRGCGLADKPILINGMPKDREFVQQLCKELPGSEAFRPRSFMDVAAAINASHLVLTVDTGVVHACTALDKPVVALYSMDAAFSTYESLSTWRLVLRPQTGHIVSDIDPAYAIAQTRGRGLPHPF
jgi:ADP-heptose:LPS heptosyltransferase